MQTPSSPFPTTDADRTAIWDMLVTRDIAAYLAGNWAGVADDFVASGFFGIDGQHSADPDQWRPRFATLADYRDEWLRQAAETRATADMASAPAALHAATQLERIDIEGDLALAHKLFEGVLPLASGGVARLSWRTQYLCRRVGSRWKIAGFVGYLARERTGGASFRVAAAVQHHTAGPYSPVVETPTGARLLVISGQAPVDPDGAVIGTTIEEQSRAVLNNCRAQLEAAGSSLRDVFKVTVYLTEIGEWTRFNAVYEEFMRQPYPARTAVETGLLPGFKVEIEMWAAKR